MLNIGFIVMIMRFIITFTVYVELYCYDLSVYKFDVVDNALIALFFLFPYYLNASLHVQFTGSEFQSCNIFKTM